MRALIAVSYLASLLLIVSLPFLFAHIMTAGLAKLHLSHATAVVIAIAIFVLGFVNIPVASVAARTAVPESALALLGLDEVFPQYTRTRNRTLIALNVGGCVIPVALACYELAHLAAGGGIGALGTTALACAVSTAICYGMARPLAGIGIVMPGLVPPLVCAGAALLLNPADAPATAFIAGVVGPLIGADLLHLRDVTTTATTGIASIGGAGTFDGIVLSGVIAAYLA